MKVLKYNKENKSDQKEIKNNTQFEICYFCQKMLKMVFQEDFNNIHQKISQKLFSTLFFKLFNNMKKKKNFFLR